MASLIHHQGQRQTEQLRPDREASDAQALSYLKDTGLTTRLATPSPPTHYLGAAGILTVGTWAAVGLAGHSVTACVVVAAVAALLATVDVLPAVWTRTHPDYASRYLAARLAFGDGRARLHLGLALVALPALAFLAAAFTVPHESVGSRVAWGCVGAAVAAGLGLLRVAHAQRTVAHTAS